MCLFGCQSRQNVCNELINFSHKDGQYKRTKYSLDNYFVSRSRLLSLNDSICINIMGGVRRASSKRGRRSSRGGCETLTRAAEKGLGRNKVDGWVGESVRPQAESAWSNKSYSAVISYY